MRPIGFVGLLFLSGCQEYDLTVFEGVDVFFQEPPSKVDILLVIDNSGSMAGWQFLVGARFNEFLIWLEAAEVDYQIGVTTTTIQKPWPSEPCSAEDIAEIPEPGHLADGLLLTRDTPNAEARFASLVNVGVCGSPDERGLQAAEAALSPENLAGANAGFIRPDAALSVVYVSDEQDASPEPVAHYLAQLYEAKGGGRRDVVNASALVVTDHAACIVDVPAENEGSRYVALAEMAGGVVGNLCNTNFADIVTEISFSASRLRDTFFLEEEPEVASLVVAVNQEEVPCASAAWTYTRVEVDGVERPAIVFDRSALPPPGAQVAVRYQLGNGVPAECAAEEAP